MKLLDEKGRLFGLVNPIDILALLAVIAVVGGIAWKLFAPTVSEVVSPQVTMTTTLRVKGVSDVLQAELTRNSPVGKKLVAGNDYIDDTKVESMEFADYWVQIQTADGQIVNTLDPIKKDVVFIVKSKVAKDTATPKIGNQEVRAGRTFIFKTNDFETYANIDSVVFE